MHFKASVFTCRLIKELLKEFSVTDGTLKKNVYLGIYLSLLLSMQNCTINTSSFIELPQVVMATGIQGQAENASLLLFPEPREIEF